MNPNPRHAFHPDLNECMLEDRCLMFAPGLFSTGFLPSTTGSSQFVVPGFSTSGGGGALIFPGPTFYYLLIGGGGGGAGLSNGAASAGISVFGLSNNNGFVNVSVGAAGSGSTSGGGGAARPAANLGYGGSFSSGYNTSLNISNNFGTVSANPVGSMPVHSFDSGAVTPAAPSGSQSNNSSSSSGTSTPDANNTELWNNLLRRNNRNSATGTTMPGMMTPPPPPPSSP
jgi:hypothetical protein